MAVRQSIKTKVEEKVDQEDSTTSPAIIQFAVGRRKRARARVRMYKGTGRVIVNGKDIKDYSFTDEQIKEALRPIVDASLGNEYDFTIKVVGGGKTGWIGAIRHGIARCIAKINNDLKKLMRKKGYLTRDPREKERKKIYKRGARRSPQFSKR